MGNCQTAAKVHLAVSAPVATVITLLAVIVWAANIYYYFFNNYSTYLAKTARIMAKLMPSVTMKAAVKTALGDGDPSKAVLHSSGDGDWRQLLRIAPQGGFTNGSNNGLFVTTPLSSYIEKYQNNATALIRNKFGSEINKIKEQEHFVYSDPDEQMEV